MKLSELRILLNRAIIPSRWSLRTRLLYTTGIPLIIGASIILLNISFTLEEKAEESIQTRLQDFVYHVERHQEELTAILATSAASMAATEEIAMAVEDNNRLALQISVSRILDNIRQSTNRKPTRLQFYLPDGKPLFNTSNSNLLEDQRRTSFELIELTKKEVKPFTGTQVLPVGPTFSSVAPIVRDNGGFVGIVEAMASYPEFFNYLGKKTGFGLAVLANAPKKSDQPADEKEPPPPVKQFSPLTFGTIDNEAITKTSFLKPGTFHSTENLHYTSQDLHDHTNASIGKIIYFYDGKYEITSTHSTIRYMTWLTLIGVFFIGLTLYLNAKRIRDFFRQLQKVLSVSPSSHQAEPFITGSIRCRKILQCDNDDCFVYQNPSKICYLEVGDRAISPKYRGSCIHLNTYKRCKECPVYRLSRGDELMQVRHVVNTLMSFWGGFLDSVGSVLSGMFKTHYSHHKPNLDDISDYLKQLAGITAYSHDLKGVYSKGEVYSQLKWIFQNRFNLTEFNLLEVNSSENRLDLVIDNANIHESHLEVFFDCELCRAKRVAEDIDSEHNPELCPYFGVDHSREIRCCMPMVMGGRVGAVFTFVIQKENWEKIKVNLGIIKKYLEETAPTLASLRLLQISKEQALRDPLTQCHNRRFMDEYLGKLEGLHHRNQRKIGFIMADLDHFKMINDEFGHLAGDEILKQLAETLRQNIRNSDLLIRYGGEEFLIILMEISQDDVALQTAEKLRQAVEDTKLVLPSGGTIKKTISMGVAEFPKDGEQLYKVIKYADVALYQAKEQGRNLALRFIPDMWEGEDY